MLKHFLILFVTIASIHSMLAQSQTKSFKGKLLTNQRYDRSKREKPKRPITKTEHNEFRSIDGTNNNIGRNRQEWGAANTFFYRELPAAYGSNDTNNEMNGTDRPSARAISNLVIDEPVTQFTERDINTLWYSWGQFIDHDMAKTPGGEEYAPIPLPEDETFFTEDIPFSRSAFRLNESKREQFNLSTAYIDGSMVYGSTTETALWLRTLVDGKLKMSDGELLPFNTLDGDYKSEIDANAPMMDNDGGGTIKTFAAGDGRAAENPVLTSLQTLFVREHNRICDRLVAEGLADDELMYQTARKEVGALIQAITYNDFLPAFGIDLQKYTGYHERVRPDIMNTFATASFRIGHTTVSDDVLVLDNDCEEIGPGEFDLIATFFNPDLVVDYGIEAFLKGAVAHDLYQTDTKINDVLRNFLFGDPSSPVRFGIDLGSINVQRGRDHGLPDYNTVRKYYTGKLAKDFADISSNDTVAENLRLLYEDVNDIDLWIGILSEDLLPQKSVGRTMHSMLKKQFENLRDGDYYFYLNDPSFSSVDRKRIGKTTLQDIIGRNSTLKALQRKIFKTENCLEEEVTVEVLEEETVISVKGAYPNPFNDILNVQLSQSEQGTETIVQIYSLDGELMKTFQNKEARNALDVAQIDTTSLKSGIYIVKVVAKGAKVRTFKVVK